MSYLNTVIMSKIWSIHEIEDGEQRGRELFELDKIKLESLIQETAHIGGGCIREEDCNKALRRTIGDKEEAKKILIQEEEAKKILIKQEEAKKILIQEEEAKKNLIQEAVVSASDI